MRNIRCLNDAELLARTDQEPAAFGVFYRRHLPMVLRFILYRVKDRELAADLTAEVFAAALSGRATFESGRGNARAWLCTIAAHKVIDSFRRGSVEDASRKRLGIAAVVFDDDDLARVDERIAASRAIPSVDELLAFLDVDVRAALEARVLDQREYADIAAELRCSEQVVRKRVSRGLARLRLQLKERP